MDKGRMNKGQGSLRGPDTRNAHDEENRRARHVPQDLRPILGGPYLGVP